jgi:hypothetical protein
MSDYFSSPNPVGSDSDITKGIASLIFFLALGSIQYNFSDGPIAPFPATDHCMLP